MPGRRLLLSSQVEVTLTVESLVDNTAEPKILYLYSDEEEFHTFPPVKFGAQTQGEHRRKRPRYPDGTDTEYPVCIYMVGGQAYVRSIEFERNLFVNGLPVNPKQTTDGVACPGWLLCHEDSVTLGSVLLIQVSYRYSTDSSEEEITLTDRQYTQFSRHMGKRFRLQDKRLGSGSTSQAILAYDETAGKQVACKMIKLQRPDRPYAWKKIDSLNLTKRFDHPNVTSLQAIYYDNHDLWQFEDLAGGGDLESLLFPPDGPNNLTWSQAHHMARQILLGVEHMHEKNVVHRDLKPGNILSAFGYDRTQRLVLTDFDLALDVTRGPTSNVGVGGTRRYFSPEQLDPNMKRTYGIGKPTDLWSVGVIIAELLGTEEGNFSTLWKKSSPKPLMIRRRRPQKASGASGQGSSSRADEPDYTEAATEADRQQWRKCLDTLKHLAEELEHPSPAAPESTEPFPSTWEPAPKISIMEDMDLVMDHLADLTEKSYPADSDEDDPADSDEDDPADSDGDESVDSDEDEPAAKIVDGPAAKVLDVIFEITGCDLDGPPELLDASNWFVVHTTVVEIMRYRTEEFPSEWFAIVEGILLTHFLIGLLTRNPQKRLTAEQALAHPWLTLSRGFFFHLQSLGQLRLDALKDKPDDAQHHLLKHFWLALLRGELSGASMDDQLQGSPSTWQRIEPRLANHPSWTAMHRGHYEKLDRELQLELQQRRGRIQPATITRIPEV